MSNSNYTSRVLDFSDKFTISCGTITIDTSHKKVLLLYDRLKNLHVLPKGRKNRDESLEDTACRETVEESGFACQLLPHTSLTHAPPADQAISASYDWSNPGKVNPHTEPLAVQQWVYADGVRKLIFWFLARGDSTQAPTSTFEDSEESYDAHWKTFDEAIRLASFEDDKRLIQRATGALDTL